VWEHVHAFLADPAVLRQQYEQGHGDPAVDVRAEHERAQLARKLTALEREKTHIPTDLVVAQEASDVESSSRLDFLVFHNLRRRFVA
jgi:hypothetical protein